MGIFGNNPLFNPQEYRTPGIGDGLPGVNQQMGDMFGAVFPSQAQNRMPMVDIPQQTKGPGFFGKGGGWRNVLGAIADGLAVAGGGRGVYAPMMEQRRQEQMLAEQEQRKFEQAKVLAGMRGPQMSSAARMAQEMGLTPGTPEYQQFIRRYAFKPTILQIPNAEGGTDYTEYDPSGGVPQQGGMQPGHVEDGYRFNGGDPADPNNWSKM